MHSAKESYILEGYYRYLFVYTWSARSMYMPNSLRWKTVTISPLVSYYYLKSPNVVPIPYTGVRNEQFSLKYIKVGANSPMRRQVLFMTAAVIFSCLHTPPSSPSTSIMVLVWAGRMHRKILVPIFQVARYSNIYHTSKCLSIKFKNVVSYITFLY